MVNYNRLAAIGTLISGISTFSSYLFASSKAQCSMALIAQKVDKLCASNSVSIESIRSFWPFLTDEKLAFRDFYSYCESQGQKFIVKWPDSVYATLKELPCDLNDSFTSRIKSLNLPKFSFEEVIQRLDSSQSPEQVCFHFYETPWFRVSLAAFAMLGFTYLLSKPPKKEPYHKV